MPPARKLTLTIALLMAVEIICSLEITMIYTALPSINREFTDLSRVAWLLTSFLLFQAGSAAIGGRLGDLFGRRRVLVIVILLSAAGSFVSAATRNLDIMILGRAIQGVSGAIIPLCYGIAREIVPREKLPFTIGCLAGAYSAATGIGYLLGGVLVDFGGWHIMFLFTGTYAALLAVPVLTLLPRGDPIARDRRRLDIVGGVLFVPAILALLVGVANGAAWGWLSPWTLSALVLGSVMLGGWAWYEAWHPNPLIDVKMLAKRDVGLANLSYALCALGCFQVGFLIMMMLQQPAALGVGLGVSASVAGLLKIPSNIGSAIASPTAGFISGRFGGWTAVTMAGVIGTAAGVMLLFHHGTVWQLVLWSILATGACAMMLAAVPNIILVSTPIERTGEATGLSTAILGVANAIGAQVVSMILAASHGNDGGSGRSFPSEAGYQLSFAFVALTALSIVAIALVASRQPRARDARPSIQP